MMTEFALQCTPKCRSSEKCFGMIFKDRLAQIFLKDIGKSSLIIAGIFLMLSGFFETFKYVALGRQNFAEYQNLKPAFQNVLSNAAERAGTRFQCIQHPWEYFWQSNVRNADTLESAPATLSDGNQRWNAARR